MGDFQTRILDFNFHFQSTRTDRWEEFARKASGPEFNAFPDQNPRKKSQARRVIIISVLGRQRQEDAEVTSQQPQGQGENLS